MFDKMWISQIWWWEFLPRHLSVFITSTILTVQFQGRMQHAQCFWQNCKWDIPRCFGNSPSKFGREFLIFLVKFFRVTARDSIPCLIVTFYTFMIGKLNWQDPFHYTCCFQYGKNLDFGLKGLNLQYFFFLKNIY